MCEMEVSKTLGLNRLPIVIYLFCIWNMEEKFRYFYQFVLLLVLIYKQYLPIILFVLKKIRFWFRILKGNILLENVMYENYIFF